MQGSQPEPLGWRWGNALTVDSKNRVSLPDRIRYCHGIPADAQGTYYVGFEDGDCLYLHTPEQHSAYMADLFRLLGVGDGLVSLPREKRRLLQMITARFQRVTTDNQGRITLPQALVEKAGISEKVVLVTSEQRTEIWAAERQEAFAREAEEEGLDDLLESLRAARPALATVGAEEGADRTWNSGEAEGSTQTSPEA